MMAILAAWKLPHSDKLLDDFASPGPVCQPETATSSLKLLRLRLLTPPSSAVREKCDTLLNGLMSSLPWPLVVLITKGSRAGSYGRLGECSYRWAEHQFWPAEYRTTALWEIVFPRRTETIWLPPDHFFVLPVGEQLKFR